MIRTKYTGVLILVILFLVISGFSCLNKSAHSFNTLNPPENYDDYKADWKKVDSLINAGLPKSALEITEMIYTHAKLEKNHPQFIKAALYKTKLKADFEEEFIEKTVSDMANALKLAEEPAKQLLHSISADLYWRYYQANRYKFLDRTSVLNFDKNDIRTWDLKTLLNEIIVHYNSSLNSPDFLKSINLKDYDVILESKEESKKFRPTLYDFLAHRAIDFYRNDESSIVQPAYRFELDTPDYFESPEDFVNLDFETKDSLSLKYYALQIFQDLVKFHIRDEDPTALVDINLKRLDFVHQNAIVPKKDSLYLTSLQEFEDKIETSSASTEISYKIAVALFNQSKKYNPEISDKYKWDAKAAVEKCQEAISRFPDSYGAKNCISLMDQIKSVHLDVTSEKVVVPDQPVLALFDYKNIKNAHFRIIKMDHGEDRILRQSNRSTAELIKNYVSLTPTKQWIQEFHDEGDYQNHSTEIKLPDLSFGYYIILVSDSKSFDPKKYHIAYSSFWSSNISYIYQNTDKGEYRFYVLDRESGDPLKNVKANLYYREYSYQSREYSFRSGGEFMSDEFGYFEVPPLESKSRSNSFFIEFSYKEDKLVTGDRFYHSGYSPAQDRKETKTFFFTDRAIYRPGQTVYFKGIVLEKYKDSWEIKTGHKSNVEFRDVNYQVISDLNLETNDYGSFNGSFTAPQGGLNGRMTIKNETGSVSVTIEEYKRPKFEVSFEPVEGSYKLNENVSIKGNAKAFAGNNISDADVKFRVVRETFFPWRFSYFWRYFDQTTMEISNGITSTDDNGNFEIEFKAIPDYAVPHKFNPTFSYTIYADVTDMNNETQSSSTIISVGYEALKINLGISDVINTREFSSFTINTTNLNGQSVEAKGEISISKLDENERLLRTKLWSNPDVMTMDKETFINNFPYDSYGKEHLPENRTTSQIGMPIPFDTKSDSVIHILSDNVWQPGRYVVKVKTTDEYGTVVEFEKYFVLYSGSGKKPPVHDINWFHVLKDKCEPGEHAKFLVGSADKNVRVLYEIVLKDKTLSKKWINLSDEQKAIEIPVTEEMRGGFSVNLVFVKHNRSYNNSFRVSVPYSNKKLDIEFATFRDKLLPGQAEEWKIKIKGQKGEKIAAELLASMYDASLDAILDHGWYFQLFHPNYSRITWNSTGAFTTMSTNVYKPQKKITNPPYREYDQLNWFGFNYYGGGYYQRNLKGYALETAQAMPGEAALDGGIEEYESLDETGENDFKIDKDDIEQVSTAAKDEQMPSIRRDFRETAFFYPSLSTDENGEILINFTVPESLTRWKLLGLAHTNDLSSGLFEKEVVTQKELMVVPNPPRFLRHGDEMKFTAKIVNLSESEVAGECELKFFNTTTMNEITSEIVTGDNVNDFKLEKGKSTSVSFELTIPHKYDVVSYRIVAMAGNYSDGEEKPLPVLSNRMLVTESLPLPVKGNETKDFFFEKLKESGKNKTLVNHKLTLEFSSNPAWYAVQALPYMMEGSYESADGVFNRFYANSIASHLANSNPKIKQVFDTWKNFSPDALLSNLEKNQELKALILNETPWVRDAQNETERKQRIALLFDLNKMADEQRAALQKLLQKQSPGGGWPWFKGMPDNRYITQQIVTGFGHLDQLDVFDAMENDQTKSRMIRAIRYLDQEIREDFNNIKEHNKNYLEENHLGNIHIQYLYARSYFMDELSVSKSDNEAFIYFKEQAKKYWVKQDNYQKGMIALALNRFGEKSIPSQIMASIKEHALYSNEMGMYWRDNTGGYYWYEAPVETQALLIEAFEEVIEDRESVEQMKIWLLKQKQTQDWDTPKATAEAAYALLLRGSDWLASDKLAEITIGDNEVDPFELENTKVEAGTGYFKTSWTGSEVEPEMGNITVKNENPGIAWGAVYWQYFEDLDKITFAETPLKLGKKLFVERNTDAGPVLDAVAEGSTIDVGNKIIVRIELRVDRDMEFVHMKDMRASAFEPTNVLSGYRYQGGLGYYESTLDASTNFFFDYLRKGTYVFQYPLVVSQKGDFLNGITTIQCMYAPEFTSHSEGVRVKVN